MYDDAVWACCACGAELAHRYVRGGRGWGSGARVLLAQQEETGLEPAYIYTPLCIAIASY
jgi:hypothetical protein